MALPSQSARVASPGRTMMARKSRQNYKPLIGGVAAVLVLGIAGWALTRSGSGHREVSPPEAATQTVAATTSAAVPEPSEPAPRLLAMESEPKAEFKPEPAPILELRQGRGGSIQHNAPETQPNPATIIADPLTNPEPALAEAPAPIYAAPSSLPSDLAPTLTAAQQKLAEGDAVAARLLFSRVLADPRVSDNDRASVRQTVATINEDLVFSPRVVKGDPFATTYVVQSGDSLIKIAQRLKVGPDWRLIKRVNKMASAQSLRLDQKLKVLPAPFHAIVDMSDFRMDVWMGPTESPDQWVYVRSFTVGLGAEDSSTPTGAFIVKKGSKLVDPPWINPRTGERFGGGDPTNPIGKFWIGLEGVGESATLAGYGIHGTIDPGSIGNKKSMGCVRLADADIALVYELMGESVSTVKIVP